MPDRQNRGKSRKWPFLTPKSAFYKGKMAIFDLKMGQNRLFHTFVHVFEPKNVIFKGLQPPGGPWRTLRKAIFDLSEPSKWTFPRLNRGRGSLCQSRIAYDTLKRSKTGKIRVSA